jgi:hypothetical protein
VKRILACRPSPAMIVASLALFVSLSGVSYGVATGFIDSREIKDNTIRAKDLKAESVGTSELKHNDVRGRDIRNSTVTTRDISFDTIKGEDVRESTLGKVPNADKLDGLDSGAFVARQPTPFFALLTLSSSWGTVSDTAAPAFSIDGLGFVHLRGLMTKSGASDTAFTLPEGARPAAPKRLPVAVGASGAGQLRVATSGAVTTTQSAEVSLDGVSFPAGG